MVNPGSGDESLWAKNGAKRKAKRKIASHGKVKKKNYTYLQETTDSA